MDRNSLNRIEIENVIEKMNKNNLVENEIEEIICSEKKIRQIKGLTEPFKICDAYSMCLFERLNFNF